MTHDEAAEIEKQLLNGLNRLASHWAALLMPSSSGGAPGGRSSDTITAIDHRVSLAHDVTLGLNGWCRVVVEDRGLTHWLPLGTDVPGMILFLERHARWLSGHEAGQDAADEVADWSRKVQSAVAPIRRDWMPLGTCPLEVEVGGVLGVCGGQVRAYPEQDPRCMDCGTEAVASWWERVMFPDAEVAEMVTADELVLVLHRAFGGTPVKPSTIRQWIKRGVIVASGRDEKGRTLYDRGAVVYAVARRAEVAG
jgi:hypothetical protein